MNLVLPTKQAIVAFRDDLLGMENLDWNFDQLVGVTADTLLHDRRQKTPAGIPMTYQLSNTATNALISLPFVPSLSVDDREVLRLAIIHLTESLNEIFNHYGIIPSRHGHMRFNCLTDDDMVLSSHYPLIPN